jgi:hypothetical protein
MSGENVVVLIGILVLAILIGFAVWKYSRLNVKIKLPLGEGELAGGETDRRSNTVATNIGGDVDRSTVTTTGGSRAAEATSTDVSTSIDGAVRQSRVHTSGGDKRA